MKPIIYILVPGELEPDPNPGLTAQAIREAEALVSHLPQKPAYVACGTGRAQLQLAKILGLKIDRYSTIFGCADRLITEHRVSKILLADGTKVHYTASTSVQDRSEAVTSFLKRADSRTIVITNRGTTVSILGVGHPKVTTLIKVKYDDGELTSVEVIPEP